MKILKRAYFCLAILSIIPFFQNDVMVTTISVKPVVYYNDKKNFGKNESGWARAYSGYLREKYQNQGSDREKALFAEFKNLAKKEIDNLSMSLLSNSDKESFKKMLDEPVTLVVVSKRGDAIKSYSYITQRLNQLENAKISSEKAVNWVKFSNKNIFLNLITFILVAFAWFTISLIFSKLTNQLENPPAFFLIEPANLLPKKHRESLIQEISDMRLEYFEALSEKKIWRARCIIAFYYIGLSWSIVMWISDKAKEVVGLVPKKD
ncbi:MAG: hypothetical protein WA584_11130 [Pyrinomonadaceae bacterium]